MHTFFVLVCSVLAIANSQDASVISFGPKRIQPRQPYIVALVNLQVTDIRMNLTLTCDDGIPSQLTITLEKQSVERYSLLVPNGVNIESECLFSAVNDGGNISVRQYADLSVARKTLSIFILTDKSIYNPGDIVQFRVVILDMATKPVNHIDSVQIDLEDSNGKSQKQWTQAVLYKGIFAASHRMSLFPALGSWTIKVTANDGIIPNVKLQQFKVREYVLPKFVINVAPSRLLLVSDKEISLSVTSHYAFGSPVRGVVHVQLFTDDNLRVAAHSERWSFDGNGVFSFVLKNELTAPDFEDHVMVWANVSLTEQSSNFTSIVTKEIPVFTHPYKIAFIKAASSYRPGIPYFCKLSVKDHYGVPVQYKTITVKTNTGVKRSVMLNNHGVASLKLPVLDNADSVEISVEFENREYQNIHTIDGIEDTSIKYLQIFLYKRNQKNSTVSFVVRSNVKFSQLFYFVTSRGNVLLAKHEWCNNKKSHMINFKLTVDMNVQSQLIVFTLDSGHLIMDYFELDYFANKLEFSVEKYPLQPDENVSINVIAEKDAYVALQAIEQRDLLLRHEGFGITKAHVLEDLNEYTPDHYLIESDPIYYFGLFVRASSNTHDEPSRTKRSTQRTRCQPSVKHTLSEIDYPESWLWKIYTMNNQSKLIISEVMPKTITSWFVTGFALSPTRGLGLMNAPTKLTVSKPFLIIANLPYSIERFEVVRIQVTLFNFLTDPLPTNVTLYNECDEFQFVDRTSSRAKILVKQAIVKQYDHPSIVSFLIKAKKLGDITIKIEAASHSRTDELKHILRVTPENLLEKFSQTELINLDSYATQNFTMGIKIPKNAEQESVKIRVMIDPLCADIPTQNLDSLFVIPSSTASSNLLNIIPKVFVLDYNKEKNINDSFIEQEAKDDLFTGYTNQLKYKHSNGAFGQWDPPQKEPSIFLTALVANAFGMASKHIEIDQTVITKAFSWINEKQKWDGCFEEDGEIIYEPMQNSASSFALTAFIITAIMENNSTAIQFSELVEEATNCLVNNFDLLTNAHDIALATYALSLTGHANRRNYLNTLIEKVFDETGGYQNVELSVETAGYTLLSFLAQHMYRDTFLTMMWLNEQRYSTGAFSGVHSTLVALKALGQFAVYLNRIQNDFLVHVRYGNHHQSFKIEQSSTVESIELPGDTRLIDVEISGIGFGSVQLDYQYHFNYSSIKKVSFNLDVNVLDTSTFEIQNLQVCFSYIPTESNKSLRIVRVEVYLPSGFIVNENALKDRNRRIKKIERVFNNTAMFVYYTEVSANRECFEVTAHQKYQIALHRASYVVVQDYYDKSKYVIKSYEGKVVESFPTCVRSDFKSKLLAIIGQN